MFEQHKDRVTLQYIGHSCALITAPDGTRIISDPYDPSHRPDELRPLPDDLEAHAVTVSHAHPDHNNVSAVGGSPQVITEAGIYQIGMVKVTGYEGGEGSPSGPSDLRHVTFVFEIGDVKIVHLGDSGPIIAQPGALAGIENTDVIMVNIDGYVILPSQIMPFMRQIKARTIIPTHYGFSEDVPLPTSESADWVRALTIEEFLKTLPSDITVARMDSEIQVTPNMPNQITVLKPLTLGV